MKPSMKPETFLLASLLLCTLLGLGYPLDCWVCISPGPFCQGTMQACAPEEDTCMAAIYETHRVGDVLVSSKKGCTTSSDCDPGFLSFNDGPESNVGATTRCCQINGCNQDPLPAFRRNLTENGLRCPSCFAFLKETCTPTQEVLCVGEETYCVTMTGLMHPGIKFAARGCGTETACHSKPGTLVP
ncbi:phospholipase A2 inhibitor and Ly6/PLAUR domain-containing protein-like [Cervus canadensis]|uniref:phospholipase A2 inhibitor and Ly6/PLAUR domain-containing protein-like n=1 Tax=Cervus canadensis TaxID=1574408 RepID=UPI001CA36120|nr:phospholipase A2 inhibitor and Ly6/PLAUR domain-containing protein-like [Cervus canadensis]